MTRRSVDIAVTDDTVAPAYGRRDSSLRRTTDARNCLYFTPL